LKSKFLNAFEYSLTGLNRAQPVPEVSLHNQGLAFKLHNPKLWDREALTSVGMVRSGNT
jgi:hypothetical protein